VGWGSLSGRVLGCRLERESGRWLGTGLERSLAELLALESVEAWAGLMARELVVPSALQLETQTANLTELGLDPRWETQWGISLVQTTEQESEARTESLWWEPPKART